MKVICFGASSSKNSINQQLASYTASRLSEVKVELLDLNDYEVPLYSIDREATLGIPDLIIQFKQKLGIALELLFRLRNIMVPTLRHLKISWTGHQE